MKKRTLLSIALIAFCVVALNSCNKVADQIAQSVGWTGVDITINVPASTAIGSYSTVGTGTFIYNLDSFLLSKTGNTLGMKNIDQFKFKSCKLTISNPDSTNNFANFTDAGASFHTSYLLTPFVLGTISGNPDIFASELMLPVNTTTNLRPYLPSSGLITIYYDLSGTMRKARTKITIVQMHIEYDIHLVP